MMFAQVTLFPESASTHAPQVDALFFFILGVTIFFTALIAVLVLTFAIKYRRRSETDRPALIEGSMRLEIIWSVIPLIIAMGMFVWGAQRLFQLGPAPGGHAGSLLCRQAMDVEIPTPRRSARNQRITRPGRPAGPNHHDLAGCDS